MPLLATLRLSAAPADFFRFYTLKSKFQRGQIVPLGKPIIKASIPLKMKKGSLPSQVIWYISFKTLLTHNSTDEFAEEKSPIITRVIAEDERILARAYTARSFIHQGENKVGDSMNKKTIYIIVAVLVVVIVAAGVGIWLLYYNGTTPAAKPSVVSATTLQFSVNETTNGAIVTYEFAGRNVNTSSLMLRVDLPGGSAGNYSYILSVSQQESWDSVNGGA